MTPTAPPDISLPSLAAPDWETITREVKCPLCGYNLRGLSEPRCPECGCQFQWPSVLDPDKDRHPYLFEHHPKRSIRSFFQTLFHQLKPSKFWRKLEPSHRPQAGRIVLYWFLCSLAILLPVIVGFVEVVRYHSQWGSPPLDQVLRNLWRDFSGSEARVVASGIAMLALFPWFNFLALMIFQQSMRRSHIRPVHVLRCAIYCGDVIVWYAIGTAIAFAGMDFVFERRSLRNPITSLFLGEGSIVTLMAFGLVAMILLNGIRLFIAYRRYMKFDHAMAAVMASQLIVVLAVMALLAYGSAYWI